MLAQQLSGFEVVNCTCPRILHNFFVLRSYGKLLLEQKRTCAIIYRNMLGQNQVQRQKHVGEVNEKLLCLNFKIQLNSTNRVCYKILWGSAHHPDRKWQNFLVRHARKCFTPPSQCLVVYGVVNKFFAIRNYPARKISSAVVETSILHYATRFMNPVYQRAIKLSLSKFYTRKSFPWSVWQRKTFRYSARRLSWKLFSHLVVSPQNVWNLQHVDSEIITIYF